MPNFEIHGQLHSCWFQALQNKGPPVNGPIFENIDLQGRAPICVCGKSVRRHQEPFKCHLTIAVTEKC
jgi:hypothetical protein